MAIFIGGAWPYANGSLHLGHIASLLPGDILARYYRLKGDKVLYVSGSDCNGTPITIRAKQEGVTPSVIADEYHQEFQTCFQALGFSYDCYTRTDTSLHHEVVQDIFKKLIESDCIDIRTVKQAYCETCEQFLPDRYVEGICPHCGLDARGDQCDHCSSILDPLELIQKRCKICTDEPVVRETEHFYFKLASLQNQLELYWHSAKETGQWRANAIELTKRYLDEGLHDRAVSRDLSVGVPVPVKGFEEKRIYVWIEAVTGYYSASKKWAEQTGESEVPFWTESTKSYYIHGKDNIPFHTIIWPSILIGAGINGLPTHIVSNEYLTLEKRKLSTSKNWAVWVPDVIENYDPDSIRYFLTINAPEQRDTDFSWREFIYSHNSELLGAYGNLINRTLKFVEKSFQGQLPPVHIAENVEMKVQALYDEVGYLVEKAQLKRALETVFSLVRWANQYFDNQKPWQQFHESQEDCAKTLGICVYVIQNLTQVLEPFLPFSSKKIGGILNLPDVSWNVLSSQAIQLSGEVKPVFKRIDTSAIEQERAKLIQQSEGDQ